MDKLSNTTLIRRTKSLTYDSSERVKIIHAFCDYKHSKKDKLTNLHNERNSQLSRATERKQQGFPGNRPTLYHYPRNSCRGLKILHYQHHIL